MTVPSTQPRTITSFAQLLQTLEGGKLHADLSEELHDMLTMMATFAAGPGGGRAAGSLTLTLKVVQEAETVRILPEIKVKTQELPRRPSSMFLTPSNNLSLEHPSQNALPFGVNQHPQPMNAQVVHSVPDRYDPQTGVVHQ